jgi:hypothetical protein
LIPTIAKIQISVILAMHTTALANLEAIDLYKHAPHPNGREKLPVMPNKLKKA